MYTQTMYSMINERAKIYIAFDPTTITFLSNKTSLPQNFFMKISVEARGLNRGSIKSVDDLVKFLNLENTSGLVRAEPNEDMKTGPGEPRGVCVNVEGDIHVFEILDNLEKAGYLSDIAYIPQRKYGRSDSECQSNARSEYMSILDSLVKRLHKSKEALPKSGRVLEALTSRGTVIETEEEEKKAVDKQFVSRITSSIIKKGSSSTRSIVEQLDRDLKAININKQLSKPNYIAIAILIQSTKVKLISLEKLSSSSAIINHLNLCLSEISAKCHLTEDDKETIFHRSQDVKLIINSSTQKYNELGNKFGLFKRHADRDKALDSITTVLQPILSKPVVNDTDLRKIVRHLIDVRDSTQESHENHGRIFRWMRLTSSRLAKQIDACIDYLVKSGIVDEDLVNEIETAKSASVINRGMIL